MTPFTVRLTFHDDLAFFLRSKESVVEGQLAERTSVKDAIESCGVPHTEVDLILLQGRPADFSSVLERNATLDVYPLNESRLTFHPENRLQAFDIEKFIADGHLGKLVRNLRLLGFDVAYEQNANDRQLLDLMVRENRALLTRDRRLLMHAIVRHGYCPRSQNGEEQTIEVVRRFKLLDLIAPFSRCLRCNTTLLDTTKAEVIHDLEPLTKIYYDQFRRCPGCGQIYWAGSHFQKLEKRIKKIQARLVGKRGD